MDSGCRALTLRQRTLAHGRLRATAIGLCSTMIRAHLGMAGRCAGGVTSATIEAGASA